MSSSPRLSGLRFYPIKSCRGVRLDRAEVGPRGLRDDRRWMLVDDEGRFLSQRRHPRMCLVRPEVEEGRLTARAPGMEPLRLPGQEEGERVPVEIWDDRTEAVDLGPAAARWFSDFLGVSCRLVRHASDAVRTVASDHAGPGTAEVAFADGFPFLLTSKRSLAELNRRLEEPLPMNRFRPNLIVEGAAAFSEDSWKTIRIGEVVFSVVKPCARCAVTTVDQESGERGKEPLQTLSAFRRGPNGVEFGQNLIHHGTGALRRGTPLEVLARTD